MTNRQHPQEECLADFSRELKQEIRASLKAWQSLDPKQAEGRRAAYALVVEVLKRKASEHHIALADIGLVDYEVPSLRDDG